MINDKIRKVIDAGICTGCGACVLLDESELSCMEDTQYGPVPKISSASIFPDILETICPALGIDYPKLYLRHYHSYPDNWLVGNTINVRTGFSSNREVRRMGASGGILTQTLIYLLESNRIDGVILAKQGVPTPEKARAVIAETKEDIINGAQSVYIPVSMLDILKKLKPEKRYAITCLPEQSAALRQMQYAGVKAANQIKFVLGPYTGTALYPAAIDSYLKSKGISGDDKIVSLKWRAGEWPGYLEIITQRGKVVRTPKVYYNFLIPFFITQTSLQSMDFVNEFADLAVGDAWSPEFESQKGGHSVIVTRNMEMELIILEMEKSGLIETKEVEPLDASNMHGHMLDFKKRGGWLRNQWRRKTGRIAPDYGYAPQSIPISRIAVEIFISTIFFAGKTSPVRWGISHIPESVMGPIFNHLRLSWKKVSKPSKRKGLAEYKVKI